MKNIKLYTKWHSGKIVCCCPEVNKCKKDHDCELMKFYYNEFEGIEECMGARKYKRNKHGAMKQI